MSRHGGGIYGKISRSGDQKRKKGKRRKGKREKKGRKGEGGGTSGTEVGYSNFIVKIVPKFK